MPVKKMVSTLAEKQRMLAAIDTKRKQQRRKAEQGIIDALNKSRVEKVLKLRNGKTVTKTNALFEKRIAAELAYFKRNRFVQRGQTKARKREIELHWQKINQAKKA